MKRYGVARSDSEDLGGALPVNAYLVVAGAPGIHEQLTARGLAKGAAQALDGVITAEM